MLIDHPLDYIFIMEPAQYICSQHVYQEDGDTLQLLIRWLHLVELGFNDITHCRFTAKTPPTHHRVQRKMNSVFAI